jgi:hypothetical protein
MVVASTDFDLKLILIVIAVDDEAEAVKSLIESRQKILQDLRTENESLRMKHFHLIEKNYNLTRDTEEALEVIGDAKQISKMLSVSFFR